MAGEKLVRLMQQAARGMNPDTEKADIVKGTVREVAPLKIRVEKKFELDASFLILSPFCWETPLWRGLEKGDRVLMLRVGGGNRFYVLQRDGDLRCCRNPYTI